MYSKIIKLMAILVFAFIVTGCSESIIFTGEFLEDPSEYEGPTLHDISSWETAYSEIFIPIEHQHIDDGSTNGADFTIFVCKYDNTLWVAAKKYQSGYGYSFNQMFDAEGKPIVYQPQQGE